MLTVLDSRELFAGMQRVTLLYPGIAANAHEGAHLRMFIPTPDGTPHARYMTMKQIDLTAQTVSIDIVHHSDGPISQWSQSVSQSDMIKVTGPAGMLTLPKAQRYFLAADRTGLPCIARYLETLHPDSTGDVVVAAPHDCDLGHYFPTTNLTVHPISPDVFEAEVLKKALALTKPGCTDYAFFAGEFQNAQALRRHFKDELGLNKLSQVSASYWRRNRPGFAN